MPPLATVAAASPLRLLRVIDIPPETLSLLRYGRGVDTSRYQEAGYRYRSTTPQAVEAFAQRLRLERAVLNYRTVRALDEVSFGLAEGELAFLVGPTGAGKTSVLRLLGGQVRPTSGEVCA